VNAADLPFAALPGEDIREVVPLSPGYDDHANDVWRVTTPSCTVVVRAPRPDLGDSGNPFWAGARQLFGLDPRDLRPIPGLHEHLRDDLGLPAPRVLATGDTNGRPWLVTEYLPGEALPDLTDAPDALLTQLGAWLARLHRDTSPCWGDLAGNRREPLHAFPRRLAETIDTLTHRFHGDDPAFTRTARELLGEIDALPVPICAAPVMLDIDPTQFLADGERLTGLIDTEAIVLGPPELELVALEPLLDEASAAAFRAGYGPLPDLDAVRPFYRYLSLLMEVQGDLPLAEWMHGPRWLSDGGTDR
jgi:aminoglycoside phosphotransferase (APT) family kinase protein